MARGQDGSLKDAKLGMLVKPFTLGVPEAAGPREFSESSEDFSTPVLLSLKAGWRKARLASRPGMKLLDHLLFYLSGGLLRPNAVVKLRKVAEDAVIAASQHGFDLDIFDREFRRR